MKSALLATVAALALCGAAGTASAAVYNLTIDDFQDVDTRMSGNNINAQFTTDSTGLVTAVTGTVRDGQGLEGFGGIGSYFYFPSYFNSKTDYLLDFYSDTNAYEFGIAADTNNTISLFELSNLTGAQIGQGTTGSITEISAVPLPATLPMFGAALLGLGAIGYGMTRNRKAALPA